LASGCATTATTGVPYWEKTSYGSWRLSRAEVRKLPIIARRNILSSASRSEHQIIRILVKAPGLDGFREVKYPPGQEDVVVTDGQGQDVRIKIDKITEIQSIRQLKREPREKRAKGDREEIGYLLIYAPLIPVAIVTWPLLRVMGLDAVKNAEDKEKAERAYGGMSRQDLITYVGEPVEKYHCYDKYGGHEVWIYGKDQVLRGGRSLFISLTEGDVYHTSHDTTFFKDSCSPLQKTP